jgi:light-independent protochlorophyllide reductase subunit N
VRETEAWAACERETAVLRGVSIAFYADALLELPLARTLRAAGASVPFVSTPKVYRKFHAAESALLAGVEILEAPDRFDAFERLSRHDPDLVVANLNVANALEGMGFNVKWSTELTFQPIRGFAGAPALFRMFASAHRRHSALATTRAAAGSPEHPIDLDFFRSARPRPQTPV